MRNDLNIKNEIFDLFDNARILFNDYYNGHNGKYTEQEITAIESAIMLIENNIKEIREEL